MKLHLSIQNGSLQGIQMDLEQGTLLLGRAADCSLRFNSEVDGGVSSRHAIIQSAPDGFYIIDQKSTNGTLVNGHYVQESRLKNGDLIQLGRTGPRIEIQMDTAPPVLPENAMQTLTRMTFYNPDKDKRSNTARTIIALIATSILLFAVMILMLASLGVEGAVVGTIIAFIPAPFYLMIYLWMDRYDPEPPWAVAAAFAWGALFSIFISFIVNTIFGSVAASFVGEPAGLTLSAIVSAPIVEEFTKGTGVVLIAIFLRNEFDGVLDGIVYAGVIGLGFATVENVLYYGGAYEKEGAGALLVTGFLRGILSPFIHSFFTSMTGIGCGIARESHNRTVQILLPFVGFCGAVTLHCLWNISAALMGGFFFVAYFVIWVPLFLAFLGLILMIARREKRIIRTNLAVEEGGLLSKSEIDRAGSLMERIRWLFSSNSWKTFKARRRYLRAVTKLAFCYWHVERAASAKAETISLPQISRFKKEISSLKALI